MGSKPDKITYNAALEAFGKTGMEDEAWALLEDMTGMQISPDVQSFNFLLLVSLFFITIALTFSLHCFTVMSLSFSGFTKRGS